MHRPRTVPEGDAVEPLAAGGLRGGLIQGAAAYCAFYASVGWFLVDLGWIAAAIIAALSVVCALCLLYFGWLTNGALVACGAVYYMYCRYNYYNLALLPDYTPPPDEKKKKQDDTTATATTTTSEPRKLVVRILNLDDAVPQQTKMMEVAQPDVQVYDAKAWGPVMRMAASFGRYKRWEAFLSSPQCFNSPHDATEKNTTTVTFYGSNDYHHLALSLIRRIRQPMNLVLLDNHPDYISCPFGTHCGSWFHQASSLPTVHQSFHFGGASGEWEDEVLCNTVFTPWSLLKSGKIRVHPATESFSVQEWKNVSTTPVREMEYTFLSLERCRRLLAPYREELAARPLYITLDKDVMNTHDCIQNWDSGYLTKREVFTLIQTLVEMSNGQLIAIDVTGDWSPVIVHGFMRRLFNYLQHDEDKGKDKPHANLVNQTTNAGLLQMLRETLNAPQPQTGDSDGHVSADVSSPSPRELAEEDSKPKMNS
eukprot:TRINITY_DN2855_c0_g3_i1.p1 TRINITY_DN2855_c0_g3~~TRINITY_DN2855_c0_g3_i1.p1  ORF type:complete len:480 (+),score=95.01 TRINITY_DN2855_c0_g3_i1:53-1492(+)